MPLYTFGIQDTFCFYFTTNDELILYLYFKLTYILTKFYYEQSRRKRLIVNLHRGFGGQNLGVNLGKFKNAVLHHGLTGVCGDLFTLDPPNIGIPNTALIMENSNTPTKIKTFFPSIVFKEMC